MATATAFAHVRRALRDRLAITDRAAREILQDVGNFRTIEPIKVDLRECVAIVGAGRRQACLYVPDSEGVIRLIATLKVDARYFERWEVMSLEDAYSLPEHLRFSSEDAVARPYAENEQKLGLELAAIDDVTMTGSLDLDPNEEMDLLFGPVPEQIVTENVDGTIVSAAIVENGTHVNVLADIGGVETPFAMIPLFGSTEDLLDYVSRRIGKPSRLFLQRPHALDRSVAIGIGEGMGKIDMIVLLCELPALQRSLRAAA